MLVYVFDFTIGSLRTCFAYLATIFTVLLQSKSCVNMKPRYLYTRLVIQPSCVALLSHTADWGHVAHQYVLTMWGKL